MKKILIMAIAVLFTTQAFSQSAARQVYNLSTELTSLSSQLAVTQEEYKSGIKKVVISTVAAAALGFVSTKLVKAKGSDISGPASVILGIAGYAVTAAVVVYDGVQAYQLSIDAKAIPALQAAIAEKQAQLHAILEADDKAQQALIEVN